MNAHKLLVSVLMFVSILFSACAPAATPAPTTIPPIAPTDVPPTSIPPTVAPTVAPHQEQTPFSSDKFKLPMSVSFGSDWSVEYNLPAKFAVSNKHDFGLSFYIVTTAKLADPIDGHLIPFPEDFLSWIKSNPDFDAVESTSVTVAGIEGLQIDATPVWKSTTSHLKLFLSLSGNMYGNLEGQPDGENIVTDPEQWRFILLNEVNGERLLIILIDGNGHNFEDAVGQSQEVLDTVTFSQPTVFSSSKFEIPMTLTYGSDWYSEGEFPDLFTLKIKGTGYAWELGFHLVNHAQIADPNSSATMPWPDDFVAYLQSNHYFEAGQPMPVTVGGVNGIQIDALVKNIGQKRTFIAMKSTDWLYLDDTEMYRFIMLDDNNGQRLLITMNAPPDGFSKATDLEQKVLDTVVFAQPTTFSPKTFNLITSVNFGSGWHVEEDLLHDLYLDNGQMPIVFNIVTAAQLVDPVGGNLMPFPDDFMSWIQSNPDFKTSELTQVTVGGINGVQIDATPNTNISKKEFGLSWNILTSDGDWRFILLDNVHGEHVLIFMIAPAGKTFSELPELQQEIQHILDSVVFG